MNRCVVLFGLVITVISACSGPEAPERPLDPWVYRSVLDERPRMITIALHEKLWSAYDVQHCGLYKAWQGGVNFDGAVYTTKHGPQPNSYGTAFVTDLLKEPIWSIEDQGQQTPVTPQYKGHSFKNGQVSLKYLIENGGEKIIIKETPEYFQSDQSPGLVRTFNVEGLHEGQTLQLRVPLNSLPNEFAYSTTGEFQVLNIETHTYGGQKTHSLNGFLILKNGTTELEAYFADLPEEIPVDGTTEGENELSVGANLIENSDCKTCHNETERTVGPSYTEIAEKYPTNEGVIKELSSKIISGGSGNWGAVPMTAHPDLTEPDAASMIRFIMSLDKAEASTPQMSAQSANLMLDVPSVSLELSADNDQSNAGETAGLATSVYLYEDHNATPMKVIEEGQPILSGVSSGIHMTGRSDFGPVINNIIVDFTGTLTVQEETNADFRLVSDDGSYLYINDKLIIDHGGYHGTEAKDGETILKPGNNSLRVVYFNAGGGGMISLQWAPHGANKYEITPGALFAHDASQIKKAVAYVPPSLLVRNIPGDQTKLTSIHPSFDLTQARPDDFKGRIGGMDFLSDGTLVVSTWDSLGPVYLLKAVTGDDPEKIEVTRIATGLAEPLGLKVVDDEIYVLQKQELTKLIDHDGDGIIDEYRTLCDDWKVSANFHEFAFGLEYQDGYFYATLATAIMPGGASANPQIQDRGKAMKISKDEGTLEFIAHGLRTPNGIGTGVDNQLFIADNQGDWLPSSKIVHLQENAWFGSRSVDFPGTEGLTETQPVVWLPQDEIGNSPSMPLLLSVGPYQGQMIHGEVTHGGIKRVYLEKINNQYQGAVFRFSQGLEAGVNRLAWGPDGALYVGGVGSSGNWSDGNQRWYGLQKLNFNHKVTFEMLAVRAKSDGLELEFTAPIESGNGHHPEEYLIKQWYYLPTEHYGGPKLDLETLNIKSVHVSEDRKKVFLELPGIKEGHVVHVRIYQPFRSSENQSLWTTEAWYNMNQIPSDAPGFRVETDAPKHNTLTTEEIEANWELLFDGKTTAGWRNFKSDKTGSAWKVRNGNLILDNRKKADGQIIGGGDLTSVNEYQDFEFTLEWKIESGGNSGIMYNVVEGEAYSRPYHTGPEYQLLDNLRHPDGRIETHRSGDLYDMIACKFVTANGADEWNKTRIISQNGKMSHWLNGYEVVSFEMHTDEWNQMIAESKFKDMPGFGKSKSGHIVLQDHGDKIEFRNIKIRAL